MKTTLFALGATLLLITIAALAFGAEAPEFPFKTTHQLSAPSPGIKPLGREIAQCTEGLVLDIHVRTEAGLWIITMTDSLFVGALYDATTPTLPLWLYFGKYNAENRRMTVVRVEAFDKALHQSPCEWLYAKQA